MNKNAARWSSDKAEPLSVPALQSWQGPQWLRRAVWFTVHKSLFTTIAAFNFSSAPEGRVVALSLFFGCRDWHSRTEWLAPDHSSQVWRLSVEPQSSDPYSGAAPHLGCSFLSLTLQSSHQQDCIELLLCAKLLWRWWKQDAEKGVNQRTTNRGNREDDVRKWWESDFR